MHRPRPRVTITSFDLCVAARESGVSWHIDNAYDGAYQFDEGTWQAAGGGRFAPTADLATPAQQTIIFHAWEPSHPGAWPNTVPPCLG